MSSVRSDQVRELERYRRAAEETLQQLDWCIDYLHAIGKRGAARTLARNRLTIRHLLNPPSAQPQ